jgi:hypothetical protein
MKTKTIYCSACDRDVVIEIADDKSESSLEGATCLDIGEMCTGTLCPICAVPPEQIRKRLNKR